MKNQINKIKDFEYNGHTIEIFEAADHNRAFISFEKAVNVDVKSKSNLPLMYKGKDHITNKHAFILGFDLLDITVTDAMIELKKIVDEICKTEEVQDGRLL